MFDLFFLDLNTSHHTPESDSMVCILPCMESSSIIPRSRGVQPNCTPRSQNWTFRWTLVACKGTIKRNKILLGVDTPTMKDLKFKKWVYYCMPKIWLGRVTPWSQNFQTLWSNISAKSKPNLKILLSGAQMGSNQEKWRWKISWHTPFNFLKM